MCDFKKRIAIVTGASSGIGEAIATSLVEAGTQVVINARRAKRLAALEDRLNGKAGKIISVAGDASDERVVEKLLDTAREGFGRDPDLIVANAGRGLKGSVLTSDKSKWLEMYRINVLGVAYLLRLAAERMLENPVSIESDRPRDLVVIGSNVGRNISPFSSMYGSTKFAVFAMTEGLRRELADKGIRVTLIEPGIVKSEFQAVAGYDSEWEKNYLEPLNPVLMPEDVARTVLFTVSQPAHVHANNIMIRTTKQVYP